MTADGVEADHGPRDADDLRGDLPAARGQGRGLLDVAATDRPGGPPTARLVVLGVSLAVALAAVIAWVLAAHLGPTAWDTSLHTGGLDHRTSALTAAGIAVSATSEYLAYVAAAVGTLLALRTRRWWVGALAGVLLLALGQGIRVALAALIGRDRPPESDWEMHAAGFSMPSGHTATATFAAGLLCLGLARGVRSAWRFAAMAALALWALVDGVGRVYIGVHWATDVVAGWLLGALLTVLAAALFARIRTAGSLPGALTTVGSSGRPEQSSRENQPSGDS